MDTNLIWQNKFFEEEVIWIHKEIPWAHDHRRNKAKMRPFSKTEKEASEEENLLESYLDFQLPELWENEFLFVSAT